MQTSLFQGAQRIIAQVLQWLTLSTDSAIAERVSDTFQNGVCFGELNGMAIVGKDIDPTLPNFFTVEIQTGVAYINGERTVILDNPLVTYNSSNPSQTTNDGTGSLVSTPQSTGSFAIPLTTGFVNYLYIAYLQTINTSVFTLNDITQGKQFYQANDGYQIVVNTTGINPDASLYILLGQVDLTGSNQAVSANISIVNRPYYKTQLKRIGIQTNNSGETDRPANYAIGSNSYFLDDHIKSVGTGTVSPFNAHGLSLTDLGVNSNDTVEFHRIHEHVNGIIAGTSANPDPLGSAFFAQRVQVTPGDDYIIIQALIANEVAVVNGVAYTSTQFGSNFTIPFSGNPSGVYNVYFDGTTFGITQTNISADETKLWLATTTWTATPGDGNLSLPYDRRQFGTLNDLERWVTAGRPQNPIPGNVGYNFDTNLMEYYNGTTWVQPLTQVVSANNILINGGFEIWQRNTVFINPTSGAYTTDRWLISHNVSALTISQESSVINPNTVSQYALKMQVNSVGGGNVCQILQVIENPTSYSGQTVTVSMWINTVAANVTLRIQDSGGENDSTPHPGDGQWHLLSVTRTLGSSISSLAIQSGFIVTTVTTDPVYFDSAMFVFGSQFTNYIPRAIGEELALCQRYYEKAYDLTIVPGTAFPSGANGLNFQRMGSAIPLNQGFPSMNFYKVSKRISPTITLYAENGTLGSVTKNRDGSPTTIGASIGASGQNSFNVINSSGTAFVAGDEISYYWTANAEI